MLLVVDNGSAFTDDLVEFLRDAGVGFERKEPHRLDHEMLHGYGSFILSGRRRNSRETNRINSEIVRHAVARRSRLLGICYGAEILALAMGGTIRRSDGTRRGGETVHVTRRNRLADRRMSVFESHGFEISRLPDSMESVAESDSCRHEIIQHRDAPVFGTQFHPEMSSDGLDLIRRFCAL